MRLFDSVGPNPRLVRLFMAERGISVPLVRVDLRGGENRRPEYLARNPAGTLPALELDDGRTISEVTAICEYLDEIAPGLSPGSSSGSSPGSSPGSSLIGATPAERAETRMWTRRIDLRICEPLANGFRWSQGLDLFRDRIRCVPEAAPGLKLVAADGLAWLDGQLAGKTWVCGERLTLADMLLFAFLDFAPKVGQPPDPALANIAAHTARMAARPSAAA